MQWQWGAMEFVSWWRVTAGFFIPRQILAQHGRSVILRVSGDLWLLRQTVSSCMRHLNGWTTLEPVLRVEY